MNLEQYKLDIYRDITYKTERDSISPTTVGDAFTDLATIVGDNFVSASTLANYYTTGQTDTKYQPVGSYQNAGNYVSASTLNNYYTTGQTNSKYQPVGAYVSASTLNSYYTTGQTDAKYQPVGSYAPFGNYVSATTLGNYYTTGQTDSKYQPVGNYQSAGNFVSASTLDNYYATGQTDSKYQPVGSYQNAGNYVSASTLGNYYTSGQTDTKYILYTGSTNNVDLGGFGLSSKQVNINTGSTSNVYGVTPYAMNITGRETHQINETQYTSNRPVAVTYAFSANPSSGLTGASDFHGIDITSSSSSNLMANARLYPFESTASYSGTDTLLGAYSSYFATVNASSGNIYAAVGSRYRLQNTSTGSITSYKAISIETWVNPLGTVTLGIGLGVDGSFQGYGIKADNPLNYIAGLNTDNFTNNTSASFNGSVGVGSGNVTGTTGKVNILSTGTQLRLFNSQTNLADISVNNGGVLSLSPSSNLTTVNGGLGVTMGITQTGANYNVYIPSAFNPAILGSAFSFGGSSVQYGRVGFFGTGTAILPSGSFYGSTIFASAPVTTNTTGGHNWIANTVFKPVAITLSGATVGNTATVLIDGVATGGNNNYALAVLNTGTTVTSISKEGYVTSTQYKLSALNTAPATSTSTGTVGEIRVTTDSIYICTATNTWVKTALTTF